MGVVIFGFDNILVPTSTNLYYYIRKNWRHYSKWFWNPGMLNQEQIQQRQFYYLNEWLISKNAESLTSSKYASLQTILLGSFINGFYSRNPYDDIEPTEFAKETVEKSICVDSGTIDRIIILSNNYTESQNKNKKEYIQNHFKNHKIEYVGLKPTETKAAYLVKNNIQFNAIVEDQIPNIRKIAEMISDLNGKEFIIPKYGYNKMPNDSWFKLLV